MKPAFMKEDDFLRDVSNARAEGANLHLWWLGQSGFLVQWQGRHLLLDPYLSDSLTRKYATTDKPHVRMTERVIAPDRLNFIQVVTSSHNHTDHLDPETLIPLMEVNPQIQFICPEANREFVTDRLRIAVEQPIGLNAGQRKQLGPFDITAVPAAHNELERDSWGRHKYLGYVVQCGPWVLYHAGDTKWYEGMEQMLLSYKVDIALLPINGDLPERRVAGNLNAREAAELARAIGANLVIPCHYDMFEFNTADPAEFAEHCRKLDQPFVILENGQRWSGFKSIASE
jgi:L-ascorbate metabolism protein UlaG (beta-lactamase superfamily)